MRYPEEIPPDMLTKYASNDMLLFTAFLGVIIGIILMYLGRKGKQLWLFVWSIGLIICSILLAVFITI